MFADQLAKIALVRISILAPVIIAITFVGAFQGSKEWGDLLVLLAIGVLGWVMKRLRWPRPPLILGFVLGAIFENNMFISIERYGAEWLTRPLVVVLFALSLYGIFAPTVKSFLANRKTKRERASATFQLRRPDADTYFTGLLAIGFAVTLIVSSGWDYGAKLVPQVVGWTAFSMTGFLLVAGLFFAPGSFKIKAGANPNEAEATADEEPHFDITADYGDLSAEEILHRALVYFAWCFGFLLVAFVIGIMPAMLVFLVGYIHFEGRESWKMTVMVSGITWILSYILFHRILIIPWPQALLGDWLPFLRSSNWLNLV